MSDAQSKKPKRIQFQVKVPEDLSATYANFALISHSATELILDFCQLMPQQPKAQVQSRIVMTPLNAKLLLRALGDNLQKFEAQFGEIQTPRQGPSLAEQFFAAASDSPDKE
jgi:hypothetical protein